MSRALLVAAGALVLAPATARAVGPASTAITTPGADARIVVGPFSVPTVRVEGTANSIPAVDIVCAWIDQYGHTNFSHAGGAGDNLVVDGNGAFAADVPAPVVEQPCRLLAISHGTTPATLDDVAYASGPRLLSAFASIDSADGKLFDYNAALSGTQAAFTFGSLGACPVGSSYLIDGITRNGDAFGCNGSAFEADPADAARPGTLVDGRPVHTATTLPKFAGAVSWTPLTLSLSDDGTRFSLHSTERLWRCATGTDPDAFPTDSGKCGDVASAGVRVDIDEVESPDGKAATQRLRFASDDGRQHSLSILLTQGFSAFTREFQFPGQSGFTTYSQGAAPEQIAPAPASIVTRVPGRPDPDPANPFAAITYAATPDAEVFSVASETFTMHYQRTIPAGKAIRLDFTYTQAAGSAELATLRTAAESAISAPPAIAFTSPSAVSTAQASVTGKVTSPEPLNAVTVNDAPVTLAADGTFSVPATLAPNSPTAFTVRATDELDRTTTATQTVTFTPPPAPATVGRLGKAKLRGRVLTTGWTVRCPGAGPDCSGVASATASVPRTARTIKAGRRAFTIKAGASARVRLTLSRKAFTALKRRHRLRLALKLVVKRAGAADLNARRSVRLKR
jgi:hypothetical protein